MGEHGLRSVRSSVVGSQSQTKLGNRLRHTTGLPGKLTEHLVDCNIAGMAGERFAKMSLREFRIPLSYGRLRNQAAGLEQTRILRGGLLQRSDCVRP
jgi:hypothetical protein